MASSGASRIMAPWRKQLVQGFMAGAYVALGGLFANLMGAGFTYQVRQCLEHRGCLQLANFSS